MINAHQLNQCVMVFGVIINCLDMQIKAGGLNAIKRLLLWKIFKEQYCTFSAYFFY